MPPLWRRRPVLTAAIVLVGALVIYERGFGRKGQGDDASRYHNRVFAVVRVVDGDTFDVDIPDANHATTRIRLWGVDTPEVAGGGDGAMYFGAEASAFAAQQLQGQEVRLVLSPTKTRGLYGRLLAYVYLEPSGAMFNEMLIERGYAYADWRFAHPYKRQFMNLEKRARRAGQGLWAEVQPEQMPPWRQRMENDRD